MKIEDMLKMQIADLDTEITDCQRDMTELCNEARQLEKVADDAKLIDQLDGLGRRMHAVKSTHDALLVKKADYQYLLNQAD